MTDEEYTLTQSQLILLAQFVNKLDLAGFLQRINQTETVAPFVDPTLYRQGAANLNQIKRLALALRPFQQEIQKQINERERWH